MKKSKDTKQRLFEMMNKIDSKFQINEDFYSGDGVEDREADSKSRNKAEELYDLGKLMYETGKNII